MNSVYYKIDKDANFTWPNMYLLRSDKVKVFPCSGRGRSVPTQTSVKTASGGANSVGAPAFNYEARANTEFNYTHVIGQNGKRSFVIDWGDDSVTDLVQTLKFAINGYYFEISGLSRKTIYEAAGVAGKLYAVISTKEYEIASQTSADGSEEYVETTAILTPLLNDTVGLDKYQATDTSYPDHFSDYVFTGLMLVATDSNTALSTNTAGVTILQILTGTNLCRESMMPTMRQGSGEDSLIVGSDSNKANGQRSAAIGTDAKTIEEATNSLAVGTGVTAYLPNQVVAGQFNETSEKATNGIFVVGTGSGDKTQRDGFAVTADDLFLQGVSFKNLTVSQKDLLKEGFESGDYAKKTTFETENYEASHFIKIATQALKLVNYEDKPVVIGLPYKKENKDNYLTNEQQLLYVNDGFIKESDLTIGSEVHPVYVTKGKVASLRQVKLTDTTEDLITALEHVATQTYNFSGEKTFKAKTTYAAPVILNNKISLSFDDVSISGNKNTLTITDNAQIKGKLTFSSEIDISTLKVSNIKAISNSITLNSDIKFAANTGITFADSGFNIGKHEVRYEYNPDKTGVLKILGGQNGKVLISAQTTLSGDVTIVGNLNAGTKQILAETLKGTNLSVTNAETRILEVKDSSKTYFKASNEGIILSAPSNKYITCSSITIIEENATLKKALTVGGSANFNSGATFKGTVVVPDVTIS